MIIRVQRSVIILKNDDIQQGKYESNIYSMD